MAEVVEPQELPDSVLGLATELAAHYTAGTLPRRTAEEPRQSAMDQVHWQDPTTLEALTSSSLYGSILVLTYRSVSISGTNMVIRKA